MGMSLSIYVGVVIRCAFPIKAVEVKTKCYCEYCGHGKKKGLSESMKYCPSCGIKLVKEKVTGNEYYESFYNIEEKSGISQDLFFWIDPEGDDEIHYLGLDDNDKYRKDVDNDFAIILEPEEIKSHLDDFNKEYGEVIEKLRPFYQNISVEYMVKSDYR